MTFHCILLANRHEWRGHWCWLTEAFLAHPFATAGQFEQFVVKCVKRAMMFSPPSPLTYPCPEAISHKQWGRGGWTVRGTQTTVQNTSYCLSHRPQGTGKYRHLDCACSQVFSRVYPFSSECVFANVESECYCVQTLSPRQLLFYGCSCLASMWSDTAWHHMSMWILSHANS